MLTALQERRHLSALLAALSVVGAASAIDDATYGVMGDIDLRVDGVGTRRMAVFVDRVSHFPARHSGYPSLCPNETHH